TTVSWDGDKLQCVQKGEKEGRGWTQWIEGDELHLKVCPPSSPWMTLLILLSFDWDGAGELLARKGQFYPHMPGAPLLTHLITSRLPLDFCQPEGPGQMLLSTPFLLPPPTEYSSLDSPSPNAYTKPEATIMTKDQNGTWEMESNENFEGYMKALDIDFATRKIAVRLNQTKIITQDGDNFKTKTNSTFRNYDLDFTVGVEFDEHTKGLDGRHVKTLIIWEGDTLVCVQKGEKENRGWKQWVEGDKLYLSVPLTDPLHTPEAHSCQGPWQWGSLLCRADQERAGLWSEVSVFSVPGDAVPEVCWMLAFARQHGSQLLSIHTSGCD
ncbi:hypothetical protein STEG23_030937, partial [Scotinomys teguina]